MAPFLDVRAFLQSLKRPICALPIALFALAVVGTLWSDAPWGARLYAVGPAAKLLMLPVLFYHFERSARGLWVLIAFLVSCALLMAMSWIVAFDPRLTLKSGAEYGVPVKNYIDQSQEFALCAVALAYPIVALLRAKRIWLAALLIAVALSFVVNMTFVIVSRTALVTMPIMLAVFALLHLKWRSIVIISCAAVVLGGAGLGGIAAVALDRRRRSRGTISSTRNKIMPTSIGLRLEFWQKSLRFICRGADHRPRHRIDARAFRAGRRSASTAPPPRSSANPHNQTLNVAVQWGAIGVVVLYAMWLVHLLLFRGEGLAAWIGLLVVVQNIFTSLFNSHLFDFHEGWMYVLGVGVAGGMVLRTSSREATGNAKLR